MRKPSNTSGKTIAQRNRAIRQDALREQLAEQCRVQHIVDNIKKFEDLDAELDAHELNRLKAANDQRIKLLNKYLPDLKQTELIGDENRPVGIRVWELHGVPGIKDAGAS